MVQDLIDPSLRIAPGFAETDTPSPMPAIGKRLSSREIRDVVEFLSTLK